MNRYFLSFLVFFTLTSVVHANPKERFEPRNVNLAIKFADKLADTKWLYHWKGEDYTFRFNRNGTIGILEGWKNIKWYVAGKEDVVLDGGVSKMLLRFNSEGTTFYTRDWDGEPADGRIVRK